jgi:hypothetical protein
MSVRRKRGGLFHNPRSGADYDTIRSFLLLLLFLSKSR